MKPAMKAKRTLIGKGTFTTAYVLPDGTVELISCDHIKECMSMGWFPDSRLFPEIEQVRDYGEDGFTRVYHMQYYERPRSLKSAMSSHDWAFYKVLRGLDSGCVDNMYMLHNMWHEAFDTIPDEFADEREDLKEALDACGNYGGDICFEISPRNVAVENGRLILLDCFFVKSQLLDRMLNQRK